jgi:hypothetical protein
MEPYAPSPGADPFAASMKLVTTLVGELQAAEAAGLTAYELEQLVADRGREVLRQMVQDHLDLRAAREEETAREHGAAVAGADGIARSRVETGHRRLLGHAVRHGAGDPVRLALPGSGQLLPRRCGLVAARRPGTPTPWPAWPCWRPRAARSKWRTPRRPAAAGR